MKLLLSGTALCVPMLAGAASAQTAERGCADLRQIVEQAGPQAFAQYGDVNQVLDADADAECAALFVLVEQNDPELAQGDRPTDGERTTDAETRTENFEATDTVTDTVEINREAVVEGEVVATMPTPDVEVEQPGSQVSVRPGDARVSVDAQAPRIVVRQAQPTIRLELAQPVITIDQPAPEIFVTMADPGVNLERSQPQVRVVTPDPQVTVSQADPEIDVNVDARLVDPDSEEANLIGNDGVRTSIRPENAEGGADTATADVSVEKGDPQVELVRPESQQAEVSVDRAEPQVSYESAEPDVQVSYSGEPQVQIRQVGEPRVTFVDPQQSAEDGQQQAAAAAGQSEQAQQPSQDERMRQAEEQRRMLGIPATGETRVDEMRQVQAQDLRGQNVVTANNENLGDISRVVENDGRRYVVVEYGGFLGFGETEVALPIERVAMQGDEVMLLGLSEADLDAMPEYDMSRDRNLESETTVEVGTISN